MIAELNSDFVFFLELVAASVAICVASLFGGLVLRAAVGWYNNIPHNEIASCSEAEVDGFSPNYPQPNAMGQKEGETPNPFAAPRTAVPIPRRPEALPVPSVYHAAGIVFVRAVAAAGIGAIFTAIASMGLS